MSLDHDEGIYSRSCSVEEFDKLRALAKAITNINVTAIALTESGVGFLVADTSLWRLGGNTAVTCAEQAKKAWKLMFMSTRLKLQDLGFTHT